MMRTIEDTRSCLQLALDRAKSKESRNKLGQYSTPYELAVEIMQAVRGLMPPHEVKFLEPAVGTGVFCSAFMNVFGGKPHLATGYEVDSHYGKPSQELWGKYGFDIRLADFLRGTPGQKYNLLVTNPPYCRHHHIPSVEKVRLKQLVKEETGLTISGLAGLYCYFLMLSAKWLEEDAISAWLVPAEFMDVNYGQAVKQYLLTQVELIRVHRFSPEDVQFADALVTSSVLIFRKRTKAHEEHEVLFTEGPAMSRPTRTRVICTRRIQAKSKWSQLFAEESFRDAGGMKLGDLFTVSRGLSTGDNGFFILDEDTVCRYRIPAMFLKQVLPAPRFMKETVVGDHLGKQSAGSQYLFSCNLQEEELREYHPSTWKYIQDGMERGVAERYTCRQRALWYSCESREPAPILIPYMGRKSSGMGLFRFILNETDMIATNSYLMLYPKKSYKDCMKDKSVLHQIWLALNAIPKADLLSNGRVYGGGLYKVEPRELMNVPVPEIPNIIEARK